MSSCFVPLCCNSYRKKSVHLFRPSKSVANKWTQAMKIRIDKVFDPGDRTHLICSDHFEDKYIDKDYKHVINGELIVIPKKKWTLHPEAVPTVFPNIPISLQPNVQPARRSLIRKITNQPTNPGDPKRRRFHADDVGGFDLSTPPPTPPAPDLSSDLSYHECKQWWDEARSEHWVHDNSQLNMFCLHRFFYNGHSPPVLQKSIVIRFGGDPADAYVLGKLVNHLLPESCRMPQTKEDLLEMITEVNRINACIGIRGFDKIAECGTGHKLNNVWYSTGCEGMGSSTVCLPCKLLYHRLLRMRPKPATHSHSNRKLRTQRLMWYYKRQRRILARKYKQQKTEIKKLKSFITTVDITTVQNYFDEHNLCPQLKETVLACIKSAKLKSKRGIQYSTSWLLECLLLRIKSPAAYNHLRESKILPLPHPRTLRNLIAGQPCQFGFSQSALNAIKKEFQGKALRDTQGVLVFDEMTVRESLDYNPHTHKLDGYADYGIENEFPKVDPTKLANHALVLMYRPVNASWVQPIAAFATRNAASGSILHKIIMQAIIKLESVGAHVLSVVCDGAKTNKLFWKLCGVGEVNGEIVNKIRHPCSDERFLYFTSDIPHVVKCIRNHFRKYTFVKVFGKEVDFSVYEKLYQEDQKRQYGLRKCPKLTRSHIWPNSFEKMNVPYATQLFSRSVATGIKFYRELGAAEFAGTEDTEDFTQFMNDMFDALNGRFPHQGITLQSEGFHLLKSILCKLMKVDVKTVNERNEDNYWFASSETLTALKITLKSTIEIIEFLITELGFLYVLTAKFNQDCLEKFFGLVRAAGGREEHPTVTNFLQLFRLLSLYSPIKRKLRSNIGTDEQVTVLVDLEASFRADAKLNRRNQRERKLHIDDIVIQKLLSGQGQGDLTLSSNTSVGIFDDNLVYYLAGYLCFRATKFIPCIDCVRSLHTDTPNNSANIDRLTKILDYGGLCYPTLAFFQMVNRWEKSICGTLGTSKQNGDIIIDCLKSLDPFTVNAGCDKDNHKEELIKALLPYYVSIRVHFYTRSIRKSLGKRTATKSKRKESKLV